MFLSQIMTYPINNIHFSIGLVEGGHNPHCPPYGEIAVSFCGPYGECPRRTYCYQRLYMSNLCCRIRFNGKVGFFSNYLCLY